MDLETRYALSVKGIPFKTEFVEYPDIELVSKKIGAKPTGTKPDGTPLYTLPIIYDPNTKTVVEDSLNIARYLDKTYPSTPSLFPNNTHVLQNAFLDASRNPAMKQLFTVVILATWKNLNPVSAEYFRRTREIIFSKALEDFVPAGEEGEKRWKEVEEGYDKIASWFSASENDGPYVLGDTVSYADIELASRTIWAKIVLGEDSEGWARIKQWNGGRWAQHLKALEKYENLA